MNEQQDDRPIAFAPLKPERDLWQGIALRLSGRRPWKGYVAGIAASLAIAASIFWWPSTTAMADFADQARAMQRAHLAALSDNAAPEQPAPLQSAFASLDSAEAEIMDALSARADNPALLRMLARVHRQRMDLMMISQGKGSLNS